MPQVRQSYIDNIAAQVQGETDFIASLRVQITEHEAIRDDLQSALSDLTPRP